MAVTWEKVVAVGATLPCVEESTSYGTPALKVAGKVMGRLRTDSDGGLTLRSSTADKEALVASADPTELIVDAWRIAAPAEVRKEYEP